MSSPFNKNKKTPTRGDIIGIGIFLLMSAAMSVWLWVMYFTYSKPSIEDYHWKTGQVASIEIEGGTGNNRMVDIHLNENRPIYRVFPESSDYKFNESQFMEDVSTGDHIDVLIKKGPPRELLFSSEAIHAVVGLRKENTYYLRIENYIQWKEDDQKYGLPLALVISISTLILTFVVTYGLITDAKEYDDKRSTTSP